MDWWFYVSKSQAIPDKPRMDKMRYLFVAGARCQLMVAKSASTIWVSTQATRRCAGKTEGQYQLQVLCGTLHAPLSDSTELYLRGASLG